MFALSDLVRATQNRRLTPVVKRLMYHALLRRVTLELAQFEFREGTPEQAGRAAAMHTALTLMLTGEKTTALSESKQLVSAM